MSKTIIRSNAKTIMSKSTSQVKGDKTSQPALIFYLWSHSIRNLLFRMVTLKDKK